MMLAKPRNPVPSATAFQQFVTIAGPSIGQSGVQQELGSDIPVGNQDLSSYVSAIPIPVSVQGDAHVPHPPLPAALYNQT